MRDQYYEQSGFECCQQTIVNAPTVEAIPIPKDATNEDILKAIFPNDAEDIIKHIKAAILNGWLNSKYERNEDESKLDES